MFTGCAFGARRLGAEIFGFFLPIYDTRLIVYSMRVLLAYIIEEKSITNNKRWLLRTLKKN